MGCRGGEWNSTSSPFFLCALRYVCCCVGVYKRLPLDWRSTMNEDSDYNTHCFILLDFICWIALRGPMDLDMEIIIKPYNTTSGFFSKLFSFLHFGG